MLWWNEDRDHDIELCALHSDHMAHALVADGYQQMHDDRTETANHPTLGAVTADPLTH